MMKAVHTSLLACAIAAGLMAHGGAEHITGTVKEIKADSLTVETTKHETLTIGLTAKTVAMKSKAKGDLKDLKAGDRVVVHAEKNSAGKLEAEEVDFGSAPASAAKAAH